MSELNQEITTSADLLINAFFNQFEKILTVEVQGVRQEHQSYILLFSEEPSDSTPGVESIGSVRSNWLVRNAPAYGFSPMGTNTPPFNPGLFEYATPDFNITRPAEDAFVEPIDTDFDTLEIESVESEEDND